MPESHRTKNGKFYERLFVKNTNGLFFIINYMTNDQIEKFLEKKESKESNTRISFKGRPTINGIFIRASDFDFLRQKNLWRIVSDSNMEAFLKTKDESLARIFHGAGFTKLN